MTTTEAADYIRELFANAQTDTQFTVEESTPPEGLLAALGNVPLAVKITGTWNGLSTAATMLIHPDRTLQDEDGPQSIATAVLMVSVSLLKRLEVMQLRRAVESSGHN